MMANFIKRLFGNKEEILPSCEEQIDAASRKSWEKGFKDGKNWALNRKAATRTSSAPFSPSPSKLHELAPSTSLPEEGEKEKITVFDIAISMGIRIDLHTMARILEFSIIGGGTNPGRPQLRGKLAPYLTVLGYAWLYGMHHDKFMKFPRGNRNYSADAFVQSCTATLADVNDMVEKHKSFHVIMPKTPSDILHYLQPVPVSSPVNRGKPSTSSSSDAVRTRVTSPFDPQVNGYFSARMSNQLGFCRRYGQGYGSHSGMLHSGIDTARGGGTYGMELFAIADGKVVFAGKGSGTFGHVLGIQHRINGVDFICRYAHNSKCFVKRGDTVKQGQLVAKVGDGNGRWAAHCHNDFIKGTNSKKVPNADTSLRTVREIEEIYLNPMSLYS